MEQEEKFNERTDDNVWFGVGTFGTSEDPIQGLGNCYRLSVVDTICGGDPNAGTPLERNIIAQAVNTGSDVANIQFDLQVGNGGTGAYNSCAGGPSSMFPGPFSEDIWGHVYGGCDYRDESEGSPSCDSLPPYPQDPTMMAANGDNLVDLCKYSFDKRVRLGAVNPTIVDMARVECPAELVHMTQLQRSDNPATFLIEEPNRPAEYQNGAPTLEPCYCSCHDNSGCKFCLTRMMDCRKPSSGYTNNMDTTLSPDAMKVIQPCAQDGYTRIDVKCGCDDCNC